MSTATKTQFKVGSTYRGVSGVGEIAITILRRTESSVWIKTNLDDNKRVKIRDIYQGHEAISYKSWICGADRTYTKQEQQKDTMYAAYYR